MPWWVEWRGEAADCRCGEDGLRVEEGGDGADSIGSDDEWRRGISRREVASTCAWWGGRGPVGRGWGSLLATRVLVRACRSWEWESLEYHYGIATSTARGSGTPYMLRRPCGAAPPVGTGATATSSPLADADWAQRGRQYATAFLTLTGLDSAEAVRPNLTGPRRHALPPGPDTARGPQRSGPDKSGNICCEIILGDALALCAALMRMMMEQKLEGLLASPAGSAALLLHYYSSISHSQA